jgi:hypothetical protein
MRVKRFLLYAIGLLLLLLINVAFMRLGPSRTASTASDPGEGAATTLGGSQIVSSGNQMIAEGRQTFRFDTFGDQAWWGDTLHLYQAIEGAKLGGVGPGVSPKTALAVGLKVDLDVLPASLPNSKPARSTSTIPRRRSPCSS